MLYSTFIFERKANLKVENIAILYSRIQAIFQANGQASVYNELKHNLINDDKRIQEKKYSCVFFTRD